MNVFATMSDATSAQVIITGRLYRKSPVLPDNIRNGKYATTLVIVA